MCCHIGHLNPPSIIHCFPMSHLTTSSDLSGRNIGEQLVLKFKHANSRSGLKPQSSTLKEISYRMRANTGRSYCNFSNLFRTFWLWFTFDKRNIDTKCTGISKSEYLLSATWFQTPEFFLNECLNILSKGWLKRLVVYLKLHYTGWMACLFSLRIHSNNHRKSYVSSDLFPFLTSYLNPTDCFQITFCLG